jgi:hypothetical protein
MQGAPWLKATLVRTAAFTLNQIAALPTKDPTSGFRMFSRRVIEQDRGRVRPGILLQHRNAGEGAPAWAGALARCRRSGSSASTALADFG